jgi:hypothetical protein
MKRSLRILALFFAFLFAFTGCRLEKTGQTDEPTNPTDAAKIETVPETDAFGRLQALNAIFQANGVRSRLSSFDREFLDDTYNIAWLGPLYEGETGLVTEQALDDWTNNVFLKKTQPEQDALPTLAQAVRDLGISQEALTTLNNKRKAREGEMVLSDGIIEALYLDEPEMKERLSATFRYSFGGESYTWEEIAKMTRAELDAIGLDEQGLSAYLDRVVRVCIDQGILDETTLRACQGE